MKKNIIITGASSGFGKEVAKLFEKDGHNMLLLSRNEDRLKALGIKGATTRSLDVANPVEYNRIVDEWVKEVGHVDLVVSNAGIMYLGQIGIQDKGEFKEMIDTNIKGVINGIQAVVKYMKEKKTGTIINISSIAGIKSFPDHAVYSGTKAAVNAISETVRQELAPHNIRVTTIEPGVFNTNLLASTTDEKIKSDYKKWVETLGDMPSPKEVANIVKYIFDAPQNLTFREVSIHPTKQVG